MVKLASHPYYTRAKGKEKMTQKDGIELDNDEDQNQMVSQESTSVEEGC